MEVKERKDIPKEFLWSITDLYENDEAWEVQFSELKNLLASFDKFNKNLTYDNIEDVLRLSDKAAHLTEKIYVYASLKSHEDTRNTFYQGMTDRAETLSTQLMTKTAFVEPSLLTLDKYKVLAVLKNTEYAHYIENIFRTCEHTLSEKEERIIALANEVRRVPENVFAMLNNADMEFDDVTNSEGDVLHLTHGKYSAYLESSDRVLRKNAFESTYRAYEKLKNTAAATYSGSVKSDMFAAKVRGYSSTLEYVLDAHNIPTDVYFNLIKTVEKRLPLLHKYIDVRKKLLGVDELHFYDIYTPLVGGYDKKIPYSEAKKTVLAAVSPLGNEYVETLTSAFENGWADVYENKGKRSGAYSWGAYGTHPFVSLNYDDTLKDVFTLAHEMGHAMHSNYTWNTQPYIYGDYTIFVAEVASTVNEALLTEYLLKESKDENEKKYLLNHFLEQFRGTLFRQTMFAEFEFKAHEMAEKGGSLTFDTLCELYSELNVKYYGKNIVQDPQIAWEWIRIPHFYTAYYVYQYATGYSAAIALSQKILNENGAENYIKFLKGGSSDYSIELLKIAGVDMGVSEPIEKALDKFEEVLKNFCDIM